AVPVTDLGDTGGRGQLRWAITHVCDGGTILVVRRGIITLQIGQLVIPSGKTLSIRAIPPTGDAPGVTIETPRTDEGDGTGRVLFVSEGADLSLQRIALAYGDATDEGLDPEDQAGGGVYVDHASLTLVFGVVSGNVGSFGGGIYNDHGSVVVTSGVVDGNDARIEGGGIYNLGGSMTLTDVRVERNNVVSWEYEGAGSGIANAGTLTLNGFTSVAENSDVVFGTGITNGGTVVMNDDSSVTGNVASFGGGIDNGGSLILNDRSAIAGNWANQGGGGVYNGGTVVLNDHSSITGNGAGFCGGGVGSYRDFGMGTVTVNPPATISRNTPDDIGWC
ncbi:MAG TPA: hypothetical protein VF984_11715, partial [Actinomycetota bacterium]